jgi:hypothetical protein
LVVVVVHRVKSVRARVAAAAADQVRQGQMHPAQPAVPVRILE